MPVDKTKSNVERVNFSCGPCRGKRVDSESNKKLLELPFQLYLYFCKKESIESEMDITILRSLILSLISSLDRLDGDELIKAKWLTAHYSLLGTQASEFKSEEWKFLFTSVVTLMEEVLEKTEDRIKVIDIGSVKVVLPISVYGLFMQHSRLLPECDYFQKWSDYYDEKINVMKDDIGYPTKSNIIHAIFKIKKSYRNNTPVFSSLPVIIPRGNKIE